MIENKQTLQQMIDSKITLDDFSNAQPDTHVIVKITCICTIEDRSHDLILAMFKEDRQDYTLNLFEQIKDTPWYDFNTKAKFIMIWKLESVAYCDEILEYFQEVLQEVDQAFSDVIIEMKQSENIDDVIQIYTHEDQVLVLNKASG